MDLTPRLLTEVEFREQWRGYSPSEVDDFIKRVAAAVGELQERLRAASERATVAERRLLERSDDDEIRRTLMLAQRTASAAVEESRSEAERILAEAHERSREQLAQAESRLADLEREIDERTRVELGVLAERRAALQADVDALVAFEEEHRSRLRAELERQLAALDEPTPLAVPEPPELSGVEAVAPEPAVAIEIPALPDPPTAAAFAPRPPTEEQVAQAREDLVDALRRAGVDEVDGPAADDEPPAAPSPQLYDDDAADDDLDVAPEVIELPSGGPGPGDDLDQVQWREPAPDEVGEDAPVTVGGEPEDDDDDPFLAELRRAVTDTEPLGPRDAEPAAPPTGPDDDVPSGRFRLRRGR